jgi:hypothetical protein
MWILEVCLKPRRGFSYRSRSRAMRDWSRFVVAVLSCAALLAPGAAWSADAIDVKNPDEFF